MEKIERVEKLGEGTYGSVYAAKAKERSPADSPASTPSQEKLVAVKRNYADISASGVWSIREADILRMLSGHPFVVSLYSVEYGDVFSESGTPMTPVAKNVNRVGIKDDQIHFVMEYVPGSCDKYITKPEFRTPERVKIMTVQLLLGLEFIHSRIIAHRDLKPANLLVSEDPEEGLRLKICDFGMAQFMTQSTVSTPGVTTSWYRAPEVCCCWSKYGREIDVWSAGCIIYEFVTGVPLFYGAKDESSEMFNMILSLYPTQVPNSTIEKLFAEGKRVPFKPRVGQYSRLSWRARMNASAAFIQEFNSTMGSYDEFCDLLDRLLEFDPTKRISITSALAHPFFAGFTQYISIVRESHPPHPPALPFLTVIDCIERKWMVRLAFTVYNERARYVWYSHRILFHAMELFDRFLAWAFQGNIVLGKMETTVKGRIFSEDGTNLRFYVCLYLMHKYYSTITMPLDWKVFVPIKYTSQEYIIAAEAFERFLLDSVTKYEIYNPTLLEITEHYDTPITEDLVKNLLHRYGTLTSWSNFSVRALYRQIVGIETGLSVVSGIKAPY